MIDPYESGLLKKPEHDRLVANLANFARDAGVQRHWVWTPMEDFCGIDEQNYVSAFRRHSMHGVAGLCYVGLKTTDVANRMAAITGKLMRNFIRARVMTLGRVLDLIATEGGVTATCLLIPNFFIKRDNGGSIAVWQTQALLDLLIERRAEGKQTVIGVESMSALGKEYGEHFVNIIDEAYKAVKV
jgi:hypothetical protein